MNLTRRHFLKTTAGALVSVGVGSAVATQAALAPCTANAEAVDEEHTACLYHLLQCGGSCPMRCTVREGKLAKIEPVKNDQTHVCLRGLAEIQRIYAPDRIKTPLKRVGKRGDGEFEAISWDEAFQTIADELSRIKAEYGGESIVMAASASPLWNFTASVLGCVQYGWYGFDLGIANGLDACTGSIGWGGSPVKCEDWLNSKSIIIIGTNVMETMIQKARVLTAARDAGAKVITIDVNHTPTAAMSDTWLPVKPGTDLAYLLAMANIIISNNWYDEEFLLAHTAAPYLVSHADGMLLTVEGSTEEAPLYAVWDKASSGVRAADEAANPALMGSYTIDGKQYDTVFSLLKGGHVQYTPEWAEGVCGISAQDIQRLAEAYACNTPASICYGYGGADRYKNADVVGHELAILAALTGNYGKPGGSVGDISVGATWYPNINYWAFPGETMYPLDPVRPLSDIIAEQDSSVHALFNLGNAIKQQICDMNQVWDWAQGLDFIVTCDVYYNDSVDLADIVLPACTRFELEDDIGNFLITNDRIQLQQKVLDPLFDSKSDFYIERGIAEALGCGNALPQTLEEYARYSLENTGDPLLEGITVDALLEHDCVMDMKYDDLYRDFADGVFYTTTGRHEFYHENMLPFGQELPVYEAPGEISDDSLAEHYPFIFAQKKSRYRLHSEFYNATWINQFTPFPVLEMNPQDAKALQIADHDLVEVKNDRGSLRMYAAYNPGVQPGLVMTTEGRWKKFTPEGDVQMLTPSQPSERSRVYPYGPTWPANDSRVAITKIEG